MKTVIIAEPLLRKLDRSDSLLSRGGLTLHPARSSEEILNLHGARRADLIITDNDLPLMGGVRLCSAIRSDPALRTVSLILVCAGAGEDLDRCRQAGANAVLPATFSQEELFARMSELLLVPRRKDIRVLLRVSVKDDGSFFAMSQNVSISGMLLECDRVLKPGDRLACAFTIGHSEVEAQCVVRRAQRTASGRCLYGVQFHNLDTKYLILIDQYVKNRLNEG